MLRPSYYNGYVDLSKNITCLARKLTNIQQNKNLKFFSLQWVLRDKIMMVSGHKNEVVNQSCFKGGVEEMLVQFIQV